MRFSLKWLLFGMAYVALAAAAVATPHWALRDLLRAVTFLSVVYAMTVAIAGRGVRRYAAIGFATAATLLLAIPALSANSPVDRIVTALFPRPRLNPNSGVFLTRAGTETHTNRLQSTNAVSVMLGGLAGLAVGTVGYRRDDRD
jgi:hypothetical protein